MLLDKLNVNKDLKSFSIEELNILRDEIKDLIIKKCSVTGGHLGPNLGVIELTIAIHYVFDLENDKLIFDVSHQSYTHKILTERKEGFIDQNKYNLYSGFSNFEESKYDTFKLGHTSSSISLSSGLVKSRELLNENYKVINVIGDGSLSGGEALEGLNNVTSLNSQYLIIVNDNEMSIEENKGGLYKSLKDLRESKGKSQNNIFKAFDIDYTYLEEGNDIQKLINKLEEIKNINHPLVLHIHTLKGKGYNPSIENKEKYHFAMPFDIESGKFNSSSPRLSYSEISYNFFSDLMNKDKSVILLTSAVAYLFGFTKERREKYKDQFVDCAIAEAHTVSFLSGLAKGNAHAYFPVTCSFLQRGFDQIIEDIALNDVNATLLICFGSIYSSKDVTHIGIFDEIMLSNIPNLIYLDPTSKEEYLKMLEYSYKEKHGPLAIRVPAKIVEDYYEDNTDYSLINKSKVVSKGKEVAIFYTGNLEFLGKEVEQELQNLNIKPTLIRQRFLSGIDSKLIDELSKDHKLFITLEDSLLSGGFGEKISSYLGNKNVYSLNYGLKKEFIDRYDINDVFYKNRLHKDLILEDIKKILTK